MRYRPNNGLIGNTGSIGPGGAVGVNSIGQLYTSRLAGLWPNAGNIIAEVLMIAGGGAGGVTIGGGGGAGGGFVYGPIQGAGGSGIVVIRYAGSARATGGTITTINVSGTSYTVHTFLTTDNFIVLG